MTALATHTPCTDPKALSPQEAHKARIDDLFARCQKQHDWLASHVIKKCGSDLLLYRFHSHQGYVHSFAHHTDELVPPIKLYASGGGGGFYELKGWRRRMGKDFFDNPHVGIRVLQYWYEQSGLFPKIFEFRYNLDIRRGTYDETIRLVSTP